MAGASVGKRAWLYALRLLGRAGRVGAGCDDGGHSRARAARADGAGGSARGRFSFQEGLRRADRTLPAGLRPGVFPGAVCALAAAIRRLEIGDSRLKTALSLNLRSLISR